MKIYMSYRPCLCSLHSGAHYHASATDIVPWDVFKTAMEKYEDGKFHYALHDVLGDIKVEGINAPLADIPVEQLHTVEEFNTRLFLEEVNCQTGKIIQELQASCAYVKGKE